MPRNAANQPFSDAKAGLSGSLERIHHIRGQIQCGENTRDLNHPYLQALHKIHLGILDRKSSAEPHLEPGSHAFCSYEGRFSLPFSDTPNCLAGDPASGRLFVSDIGDLHMLDPDGGLLRSFGLNCFKPRVQCVEEDMVWVRDLAEDARRYLALGFDGRVGKEIPVSGLLPGRDANEYMPVAMSRNGVETYFLLVHQISHHSIILCRNSSTGKDRILHDVGHERFAFLVSAYGGDLFITDYSTNTVSRQHGPGSPPEPYVSLSGNDTLRKFEPAGNHVIAISDKKLYLFDSQGQLLETLSLARATGLSAMKICGSALVPGRDASRLFLLDRRNLCLLCFSLGGLERGEP